jgi:hypothetical protein
MKKVRYEIGLLLFVGVLFILPAVTHASDVNINPDLLTKRRQASWVSYHTGLTGKFLWNGKSVTLKPGPQTVAL